MILYKTEKSIVIEQDNSLYILENQDWDSFVNDDHLFGKITDTIRTLEPAKISKDQLLNELHAPIQNQEVWACGVTYYNSKLGREEESRDAGGGTFYSKVYDAERPEIFFKATAYRTVGPDENVRIRKDSAWDVPEPELTLAVTSSGKIVGYTIGNDMSSRSIEGENPLYLPQAKSYDGSTAVGPGIFVTEDPLPAETEIRMEILRNGNPAYSGNIDIDQMKRTPKELVSWLYRECTFPHGCLLMTGTGIVPGSDFTLQSGDEIRITIDPIGTLVNRVG
ncbi:MAG: fumarylacetoacetate hydrolase family protein [Balneolaceae bacterium]